MLTQLFQLQSNLYHPNDSLHIFTYYTSHLHSPSFGTRTPTQANSALPCLSDKKRWFYSNQKLKGPVRWFQIHWPCPLVYIVQFTGHSVMKNCGICIEYCRTVFILIYFSVGPEKAAKLEHSQKVLKAAMYHFFYSKRKVIQFQLKSLVWAVPSHFSNCISSSALWISVCSRRWIRSSSH